MKKIELFKDSCKYYMGMEIGLLVVTILLVTIAGVSPWSLVADILYVTGVLVAATALFHWRAVRKEAEKEQSKGE